MLKEKQSVCIVGFCSLDYDFYPYDKGYCFQQKSNFKIQLFRLSSTPKCFYNVGVIWH